jgi:hypothetical protein
MTARFDAITEQIYARWVDQWVVDGEPRTPFCFGNEAFDPPDGPWVRLWVRATPSGQETLGRPGNRKFHRPGLVVAAIREPAGQGVQIGHQLGEAVRDIFEAQRLPPYDLRFEAIDILPIGEIEDGRWWASTAQGPFGYEDIR